MKAPPIWNVDALIRDRLVIVEFEHAANRFAQLCPVDAIERYVERCHHAERLARMCDLLISAISAFVAPAIVLGFITGLGLIVSMVFVVLWTLVGLDQCMRHLAATHARAVASACEELAQSAEVQINVADYLTARRATT